MITFMKFYADWCGPCQVLKPIVEELKQEHPNVEFVEVDIDNNRDLATLHGVMSIPTTIIFRDDAEIMRFTGMRSKEEYSKFLS